MTTNSESERESVGNFDGAVAYVGASSATGRSALNRFYNGSTDHRDCACSSVTGYSSEGTNGYVWNSSGAGMAAIKGGHNGGDYATFADNESILSGYSTDTTFGYGYVRYLNDSGAHATGDPVVYDNLSAGGVSINSNQVAGDAIWEWNYGGDQYLENSDYGRLMQSAVFFTDSASGLLATYHANPTEGGDFYSGDSANWQQPGKWHGSPLYAAATIDSGTSPTQHTRAIPLEWGDPGDSTSATHWGISRQHPVLWKDMVLGKDITLNYSSMGPVAHYQTYLSLPNALNTVTVLGSSYGPAIQIPTIYLNSTYDHFWHFEPTVDTHAVAQTISAGSTQKWNLNGNSTNYAGVIIGNSDGSKAMGLFGKRRTNGGSVDELYLVNGTNATHPYTNLYASYAPSSISSGTHNFSTYVMSGTVTEVEGYMNSLASAGVS